MDKPETGRTAAEHRAIAEHYVRRAETLRGDDPRSFSGLAEAHALCSIARSLETLVYQGRCR
jgi:hypothetical protein